jgi:hypothetical protein
MNLLIECAASSQCGGERSNPQAEARNGEPMSRNIGELDSADDVPGSNQLLPNTHTYNVTAARQRADSAYPPHYWPIIYYQQRVASGLAPEYRNNRELIKQKPRGVLEKVE